MKKQSIVAWSIEFGPIILFFIFLEIFGDTDSGFIFSTAIFTGATIIALIASRIYEDRIAIFPLVAGVFVVTFGILTVTFQDPYMFVLKDTLYNGLFFVLLLVGVLRGKGYLEYLFSSLFDLTAKGWYKLSFRWMVMFFILVVTNEYFWRVFPLEFWVRYKIIATVVTVVFGLYQIFLARDHRNETASPWGLRIEPLKKRKNIGIPQEEKRIL